MGMLNSDFTVRKIKLGASHILPKKHILLSRLGEIADRRMRRDYFQKILMLDMPIESSVNLESIYIKLT